MITADQVDTACKELHFSIIQMYLAEKPSEHWSTFNTALKKVSEVLPESAEALQTIAHLVERNEFYPALKQSLTLVSLEAQIEKGERPRFNKPAPGAAPTRSVELGPSERLVLGSAIVRNCEIRARLAIDADANFIQGKHLIQESEADTSCKRLYVVIQNMCMASDPAPLMEKFNETAHEVIARMPNAVPQIVAIHERVEGRKFLQALAAGRELIANEAAHGFGPPLLRKSA